MNIFKIILIPMCLGGLIGGFCGEFFGLWGLLISFPCSFLLGFYAKNISIFFGIKE
jgi:hypothetical protein